MHTCLILDCNMINHYIVPCYIHYMISQQIIAWLCSFDNKWKLLLQAVIDPV